MVPDETRLPIDLHLTSELSNFLPFLIVFLLFSLAFSVFDNDEIHFDSTIVSSS